MLPNLPIFSKKPSKLSIWGRTPFEDQVKELPNRLKTSTHKNSIHNNSTHNNSTHNNKPLTQKVDSTLHLTRTDLISVSDCPGGVAGVTSCYLVCRGGKSAGNPELLVHWRQGVLGFDKLLLKNFSHVMEIYLQLPLNISLSIRIQLF